MAGAAVMGRAAPSAGDTDHQVNESDLLVRRRADVIIAVNVLGPVAATGMRRIQVPSLAIRVETLPILTVKAPGEVSVPLTVSWRLAGALWSGPGWGER